MPDEAAAPSGGRLWIFRLAALILAPVLFLLTAEAGLRLFGYGYPTAFFVPLEGREEAWTTNPRFGWRFFPRRLARTPVPLVVPADKGDAYRVFVLGGSAARGTPDSAYSFGRVLQVLLEARYPSVRFEVFNTAMTAVNSHVVRHVARACARRQADLFVVYLGNNEVVGPYGAGTVFGTFSPSLTAIRSAIAFEATRFGQLFEATLVGRDARHGEWRGMEMFLEQRIAAADPRLEKVYEHLAGNLEDIARSAHDGGAETLLVTVATNLRDQPPFASLHRPDLTAAEEERWQALVNAGTRLAEGGDHAAALASWEDAAAIDDRYAELHFRAGRSLLALGRTDEARRHLVQARDLDALRFRADSPVNEVIRRVAEAHAERGVSLLDAARLFAEGDRRFAEGGVGTPPLPGYRLFHEHVHLSFDGNVALAAAIEEHLAPRLPERIRQRQAPGVRSPTRRQVADRLALTAFDRHELAGDMLRITSRPPFVGQLGHAADLERRRRRLADLGRGLDAEAWHDAEALYRSRLEEDPQDLELRRRFATLLQARRQPEDAIEQWRFLLARLPGVDPWRAALATSLADAGRGDEALAELAELRRTGGDSARLQVNRGTVLESMERYAEADDVYREALRLHPGNTLAAFNLATSALRRDELDRAASRYLELLDDHPDFAPGHHNLGRCRERQGRFDDAEAAYRRALEADPGSASAHNSLGLLLERRGAPEAALAEYRQAVAYDPRHALAHFNLADLLLSRGNAADAEIHYGHGLALSPENVQARYNRAGALQILGEDARAAEAFARVLTDRPDHPGALNNLAWILATSERAEVRDPSRAVELAERAVRVAGAAPELLETLAAAYSAAGRTADARATWQRAAQR